MEETRRPRSFQGQGTAGWVGGKIMRDHDPAPSKDKSSSGQPPTRRSLHRTLSDESIYRGQRVPSLRLGDLEPDPSLASDVLFSCSTLPRSPTTRGVPLRRPSYKLGIKLHGDLSASDTSLAEMVERQRHPLPQELMPLPPSESRDSPLDWTHLVDVASTFETVTETAASSIYIIKMPNGKISRQRLQEDSQSSLLKLKKFHIVWFFSTHHRQN
ncbi:signal-induced proliferation-associated 1-like protein 1 [Salvelinus sp. IW2-2015]|uniref:signal-induced proliferation-associated 1-like protein 1 n=1 Tax=Salvelinus sp. IW2-2015 TaxID=2691554 RepID=UPI000CEAAD57|nr:signal-induced proliferation-associated 1-like protein 1 [Salvelinus alpinus]